MRHPRRYGQESLTSHWRWLIPVLVLLLPLLHSTAMGALQFSTQPNCDWSNQSYDDFYLPPPLGELTPERLGEILRVEFLRWYTAAEVAAEADLPYSFYGAAAYRILYLSQLPSGEPQAISGFMVVPVGIPPENGYPIVNFGHGTTGMADKCAPTTSTLNINRLLPWIAHGFMVSSSDYTGLGTPGMHPYAVGESEATSMLDGARAALRFCDNERGFFSPPADNQIFFIGHSQGGHAALFAHQYWATYAPELNLLGTVAFAPGSETRLLTQEIAKGASLLLTPSTMAMAAYSQYYTGLDDLNSLLLEPYASQIVDKVEDQCLLGLIAWIGFDPEPVFQPDALAAAQEGRWKDLQPWTAYLDINTPGNFGSDVPVLILQGEDDLYISADVVKALRWRLCFHHTPVILSFYANVGHTAIIQVGRAEALSWMEDRLTGVPAPNSCPDIYHHFLPVVFP